MQWKPYQLKANLKNPLPPLILVYGDDGGVVRQLSTQIIEHTGVPLDDPFASDKLDATEIANNSSALAESAGTISLMGGLRLVKIEGLSGETPANTITSLTSAVKGCLETNPQEVVVVIPAPRLGKDNALVRLIEKSKTAVAIRCFQDNVRDLGTYITTALQKESKTISPAAKTLMLENLGADRDITNRELEKLAIYMGEKTNVEVEDVTACLADAPAANVFKLCDAVGNRNPKQAEKLLTQLLEEGEDANMLFTMVIRHLRRVLQAKEAMANGQLENQALRSLTPPIMFGQDVFMAQVRRNPLPRLQKVVERAVQLQYQTREYALLPELHLTRGIIALSC